MEGPMFTFPAVRGIQAKHEYYIAMIPLEVVAKVLPFADEGLSPEERAQRVLKQDRIPEIRDYILKNPDSYVFSSLTFSVDGEMEFVPSDVTMQIGMLNIGMTSRFLINDGQHRRAAIAEAIQLNPDLKQEHISVVFFRDAGLKASQQIFSDLNRYAIKPTKSINILYNSREEMSIITKTVVEEVDVFYGLVEKEKTTVSNRSKALFTLSAIHAATSELLNNVQGSMERRLELAIRFWTAVSLCIPAWGDVRLGRRKASEIRKESICSLSITLVALGFAGNALMSAYPKNWERKLQALKKIDWKKDNPVWNNLVFVNGKVAANRSTQRAMSNYLKKTLFEMAGTRNG